MNGAVLGIDVQCALVIDEGLGVIFQDEEFLPLGEIEFRFSQSDSLRRLLATTLFLLRLDGLWKDQGEHQKQPEYTIDMK